MIRINIKYILVLISGLLMACGPQAVLFDVEVRKEADTDLQYSNGNTAVFFVIPKTSDSLMNVSDSLYLSYAAIGLAEKIEEDKEIESEKIGVYALLQNEFCGFGKSADANYFNDLMLSSGAQNEIFIRDFNFDKYSVEKVANEYYNEYNSVSITIPYAIKMDVYNALSNKLIYGKVLNDTVFINAYYENYRNNNFESLIIKKLPEISNKIGAKLGALLSPQWEAETLMLINYNSIPKWKEACSKAIDSFKWDEAIKLWMPYTKSDNACKAAYAAYNIAIGCQMNEQFDIAKQWIDFAEKQYNFRELQLLKNKLLKQSNSSK